MPSSELKAPGPRCESRCTHTKHSITLRSERAWIHTKNGEAGRQVVCVYLCCKPERHSPNFQFGDVSGVDSEFLQLCNFYKVRSSTFFNGNAGSRHACCCMCHRMEEVCEWFRELECAVVMSQAAIESTQPHDEKPKIAKSKSVKYGIV